jgi:hexosaminidase
MKLTTSTLLIVLLFTLSCQPKREIKFPTTNLEEAAVIPKPLEITASSSGFALDQYTELSVVSEDEAFEDVANYLSDKIKNRTGIDLNKVTRSYTQLSIQQAEGFTNEEGYELEIRQDSLILKAGTAVGAFRGIQTIRQLIPEEANETLTDFPIWIIPTGTIKDEPQFGFRSTMLDVARHFFPVEDVKKYIDILAYYKLNTFHMHLTDDQGWRIEIKSWPKLTEEGSTTGVGGGPGGFYTQEDYKEIVAYAAERYITVIPEVDMPGHTNSASLAYPFLNGNGKEIEVVTSMAVGYSTFDTRKDTVYAFIDDVIREISAMSPGPYFHIGGDESLVTEDDDYVYFIEKVEKIVSKYGKKMIGWDEVATANLGSEAVAQWWNSQKNAELAIKQNMKLILSPAKKAYLDMKYDDNSEFGLRWAGYIPVDTAYIWNPESYFPMENVLGVEAPLWSETIRTLDELEYLAFPRVIGYAELGWSTQENRNWEDYKKRLAHHRLFLDANGVNYYKSPVIEIEH